MELDTLDRRLLNIIQTQFPITSRPYEEISFSLGVAEQEVIERIARLKEKEIIKHIRGVFDYQKLGYQGVLCAVAVEENLIKETADFINKFPGVTHNYLRNHDFNLWFTLITPSEVLRQGILKEISELKAVNKLMILPSLRTFKIKVNFHFEEVKDVNRKR